MKKGRASDEAMLRRREATSGLIWRGIKMVREGEGEGQGGEEEDEWMGTGLRTPVVERKRERRRGLEKQTATLENAVIITAMARSPRQLMVKRRVVQFGVCHETEDVGGGGASKRCGNLRDIAIPIDTDDAVE